MKVNILLCLFFLGISLQLINCIKFGFIINPGTMKCMGEYLSESTLAIFSVKSTINETRVRIFDPNGQTLYMKEQQPNYKMGLTATEGGNHQICIENLGQADSNIDFEFLSGVMAKDYSEVAKKSNLKPVELSLQKLEDMCNYLMRDISSTMQNEESSMAMNDSLSNKIILFSVLTLGVMILVGFVETIYLQKFFHNKKII